MSRLSCKDTLLDRVKRPGMLGALGRVSTASVQTAAGAWRSGRACPTREMVTRLEAAVPLAEAWLQDRACKAAILNARRQLLRARLNQLPHGACKKATITLRRIAEAAGFSLQFLTNFRAGDTAMSEARVEVLERVMQELGLMPAVGKVNEEGGMP